MIFLFRSGTLRQKLWLVFKATRQHAKNLGLFALIYKSTLLALRYTSPQRKERDYDTFVAGLLGGYYVFGRRQSSINQQIVIYVFARAMLALAKYSIKGAEEGGLGLVKTEKTRELIRGNAWAVFASLSWAMVMYMFRWHPETVQSSLRSSMQYMWVFLSTSRLSMIANRKHRYVDSDHWDSLRNFVRHNK